MSSEILSSFSNGHPWAKLMVLESDQCADAVRQTSAAGHLQHYMLLWLAAAHSPNAAPWLLPFYL